MQRNTRPNENIEVYELDISNIQNETEEKLWIQLMDKGANQLRITEQFQSDPDFRELFQATVDFVTECNQLPLDHQRALGSVCRLYADLNTLIGNAQKNLSRIDLSKEDVEKNEDFQNYFASLNQFYLALTKNIKSTTAELKNINKNSQKSALSDKGRGNITTWLKNISSNEKEGEYLKNEFLIPYVEQFFAEDSSISKYSYVDMKPNALYPCRLENENKDVVVRIKNFQMFCRKSSTANGYTYVVLKEPINNETVNREDAKGTYASVHELYAKVTWITSQSQVTFTKLEGYLDRRQKWDQLTDLNQKQMLNRADYIGAKDPAVFADINFDNNEMIFTHHTVQRKLGELDLFRGLDRIPPIGGNKSEINKRTDLCLQWTLNLPKSYRNQIYKNKIKHLDIKLENVRITPNSKTQKLKESYFIDLEFSRALENNEFHSTVGTPEYMTPDLRKAIFISGKPVMTNTATDIYAMAVMILEIWNPSLLKEYENLIENFRATRIDRAKKLEELEQTIIEKIFKPFEVFLEKETDLSPEHRKKLSKLLVGKFSNDSQEGGMTNTDESQSPDINTVIDIIESIRIERKAKSQKIHPSRLLNAYNNANNARFDLEKINASYQPYKVPQEKIYSQEIYSKEWEDEQQNLQNNNVTASKTHVDKEESDLEEINRIISQSVVLLPDEKNIIEEYVESLAVKAFEGIQTKKDLIAKKDEIFQTYHDYLRMLLKIDVDLKDLIKTYKDQPNRDKKIVASLNSLQQDLDRTFSKRTKYRLTLDNVEKLGQIYKKALDHKVFAKFKKLQSLVMTAYDQRPENETLYAAKQNLRKIITQYEDGSASYLCNYYLKRRAYSEARIKDIQAFKRMIDTAKTVDDLCTNLAERTATMKDGSIFKSELRTNLIAEIEKISSPKENLNTAKAKLRNVIKEYTEGSASSFYNHFLRRRAYSEARLKSILSLKDIINQATNITDLCQTVANKSAQIEDGTIFKSTLRTKLMAAIKEINSEALKDLGLIVKKGNLYSYSKLKSD